VGLTRALKLKKKILLNRLEKRVSDKLLNAESVHKINHKVREKRIALFIIKNRNNQNHGWYSGICYCFGSCGSKLLHSNTTSGT
jgi:hypothetical protein